MKIGQLEIELFANVARIAKDMDQARQVVGKATDSMARAANAAKAALGSIGAGIGLSQIIQMTDQYTKFTAQLRLATQSTREYAAAYGDVKRIATAAQQDLQATGMLYARIANGTRELGTSQKQVAAITETVNMALKVSGASAQESASAQLQLSQAFASGTLRGEEFNAVNEAAPRLMKALADGMGVPVGALKEMATEGKITSAIMAEVLPRALEDLRNEAKEVQTIAGAFTVLKNNVMEFVGVQANASGGVAMLTGAIGMLANNLGLLAGGLATVIAVKTGNWLAGVVSQTYASVTANRALLASNLETARSHMASAGATASLATARVAELRSAVLAAEGEVALAITVNGLIPALARETAALNASTAAKTAFATASGAASVSAGAMRGALALVGGPIGAIITALTLGATAWLTWGNKAKEGNDLAKESAVEASGVIIAELDKQIAKNERIIEMRKQGASFDEANKNLKNTAALGALGNDLAALNRGDGQYGSMSNDEKFFAREKLMKSILALQGKIALAETTGAAAKALTMAEARNKFMSEYATKQEQMNAKLKEARELLGTSFTAEDEARIRKHYEVKATVSKAASKAESDAEKARLQAAKEIADAAAEAIKIQSDYATKLGQSVAEANREAEANEELARTFGMSKAAIEAETIAKMERRIETLRGIEQADDAIAALELEIAARKRSAAAMSSVEAQAAAKNATEDIAADYKRMSESIESSLTDALLRGFESGKSFGRNLIDTLKNMFSTLILRPTIQGILAPMAGSMAAMMPGSAQAGTAGSSQYVSLAQSAQAAYSAISAGFDGISTAVADGVQVGMNATGMSNNILSNGSAANYTGQIAGAVAGYMAGTALNKTISGGYETGSGFMKFEKVGTAVLSAINPALGAISGVVYGLVNRAFGMKDKETTSTTINGAFGANGFAGSTDAAWSQKGGWFRSDKSGIDKTVIDAATAKQFGAGYDAIKAASVDFAQVLGLSAESVATRTQSMSIAMTKDAEANKKAISDFFVGIGDAIAKELLPTISEFAKEGESAGATFQRIASNYAMIDVALQSLGMTFGTVGVDSIAARERLIELSGGLDAFAQNAAGFAQNFLTEGERNEQALEAVSKQMSALGFASVDTNAEFKALVLGLNLTTEEGARNYAELMKLQGAFAAVHPMIEATTEAIVEQVDALQLMRDAASGLLDGVDASMAVLQRVISAEKSRLAEAHTVTMTALQQRIDTESAAIAKHKSLSDAIGSTLDQMRGAAGGMDRADAQAQVASALAIARAGGALPSADSLKGALSALSKDSSAQFATLQDYQRDFFRTQGDLAALGAISDTALSVEEKSLAALIDQKDLVQKAYDAEVTRLDAIVSSAQQQIDVLRGIDTTGLSIKQAIEALSGSILAAQKNPLAGSGALINDAYKSALGRAPDAAGSQFWQDQIAGGTPVSSVIGAINGSQEAQVQALYKQLLGRNADAGGLNYFMSAGASIDAIRNALMQSDEYKRRVPGFAAGGDFGGGLRIVGENGPELEATGPSRIFNARQTSQMLGGDNSELVAELRALRTEVRDQRSELARIAGTSKRTADTLDIVTEGGNAMRTTT